MTSFVLCGLKKMTYRSVEVKTKPSKWCKVLVLCYHWNLPVINEPKTHSNYFDQSTIL